MVLRVTRTDYGTVLISLPTRADPVSRKERGVRQSLEERQMYRRGTTEACTVEVRGFSSSVVRKDSESGSRSKHIVDAVGKPILLSPSSYLLIDSRIYVLHTKYPPLETSNR